ncbi:MAG: thiol reductase thioredoxin [Acidobacteria bacterium SCN 69-37]|nr:MAG: thiol reductase thioredoxin [Acidobacteria bacterium SCN 69-37]
MVITCGSCQRRNRVPASKLTHTVRCGACQAPLTPIRTPLAVDPASFDEIVASASVPILVDFWAEWCGPCRRAAPEVARTADTMAGRALVLKVDTEAHPTLAQRFRVSGIPNFVVIKDGRTVFQQAGLVESAQMVRWLEQA